MLVAFIPYPLPAPFLVIYMFIWLHHHILYKVSSHWLANQVEMKAAITELPGAFKLCACGFYSLPFASRISGHLYIYMVTSSHLI